VFDLNAALRREFDQRRADFRAGVRLAMTPTGLENPSQQSPETAESPVFCGFGRAQDAMFAHRSEANTSINVGTGDKL
jgi:hypothetical protein